MEAAGLEGCKWGVISRVESIYEAAIATVYPALCVIHENKWQIGVPRSPTRTGLPTGPRFIRIHPDLVPQCRGSAERVSAEEARKVFATILHGLDDFNIGSKAHQGLLVMTNRKDVKAALATRVGVDPKKHVQIENVVTVAGVTARHGLILQFNTGFLSGRGRDMTQDDITEAYLRTNVGFTRAANSLVFASPLDTAGLPGVFQTSAALTTGVSTLQRATDYYNFELSNPISNKELSTQEWAEGTSGKELVPSHCRSLSLKCKHE